MSEEKEPIKSISSDEAKEILSPGEHKFLLEVNPTDNQIIGRVYILSKALKDETNPRRHEDIMRDMLKMNIFKNQDNVRGGYCQVMDRKGGKKLQYWGASTSPVKAAREEEFEMGIENGVALIDQWLSQESKGESE